MVAIVYLVAGISSRFGGNIKQFAKIGPDDQTLIEYSLNQALKSAFDKIIFIVGNLTEKPFQAMFGDNYKGIPVYYAQQKYDPKYRDRPWGTADALMSIKEYINSSFVICNGDDIYGETAFKILFDHLNNNSNTNENATIGYHLKDTLSNSGTVNRGIFKLDDNKIYVEGITETFNIDNSSSMVENNSDILCSMNIFAFHENILPLMEDTVIQFKKSPDRKIECYLPEEISKLIVGGSIKLKIYSALDKWQGITYPSDVSNIIISR